MGFGLARPDREPDERAFTDHNMLHLAAAHRPEVELKLFDQSEEAKTGADFEWWIGDGFLYLPMLVQAKRLTRRDNYSGLGRRIGTAGPRQINRLIRVCTRGISGASGGDYVGYLPLYLFYNGPLSTGLPNDSCCGAVAGDDLRGCTLADARAVRRAMGAPHRRSTHIDRIGPHCRPWSCLFCCPGQAGLTPLARWAAELLTQPDAPPRFSVNAPNSPGISLRRWIQNCSRSARQRE